MINDIIQSELKKKNVIIGYRRSLKYIKLNPARIVVLAKNTPENIKKEVENNIDKSKTKIEIFEGTTKDLGVFCGKSFPISVLVIK